jgi:hypothetical protein
MKTKLIFAFVALGAVMNIQNTRALDLIPGNILFVSENFLVQVDRQAEIVDAIFLNQSPGDLGFQRNGDIIVTSGGGYSFPEVTTSITRVNADGEEQSTLQLPTWFERVTIDSEGNHYLARDYSIFKFDPFGNLIDAFLVPPAPGTAMGVGGIVVKPDGEILVASVSFNQRSSIIYRLNPDGDEIGQLFAIEKTVTGLSMADDNTIIFATSPESRTSGFITEGSRIFQIDNDGIIISEILTPFRISGIAAVTSPNLTLERIGESLTVKWPDAFGTMQLASTQHLGASADWSLVGAETQSIGGESVVELVNQVAMLFFRLQALR